jgi:glutamate dehydrogenase
VLNIIEVSRLHDYDYSSVAKMYFAVIDRLDLLWFRDLIDTYPNDTHWMILAKASYKGDLDWVQRELTLSVLKMPSDISDSGKRIAEWVACHQSAIDRWESVLVRLRSAETREFAMLSVAIRELAEIAQII